MEQTDLQILAHLSRDGRMSFTELGRKVGLSTSATQQRVRRLEQRGVITGYSAQISPRELGRPLTAFVELHSMGVHQDEPAPDFLATLSQMTSCYSVAGEATYLCVVQVGSAEELDEVLTRIRTELGMKTVTTLVLTTRFQNRPLV